MDSNSKPSIKALAKSSKRKRAKSTHAKDKRSKHPNNTELPRSYFEEICDKGVMRFVMIEDLTHVAVSPLFLDSYGGHYRTASQSKPSMPKVDQLSGTVRCFYLSLRMVS
jgi:hypothetical protein